MKIISWVLISLAILFLLIGMWLLSTAYLSSQWPVAEGRITATKVAARISQAGDALRRHLVYHIEVTYSYQVAGKNYENSRYSLGSGDTVQGGFNDRAAARTWLRDSPWQLNRLVPVHVDPDDPENTVLSAGINWGTWVPMIMAAVFFLLGYMIQVMLRKTAARTATTDAINQNHF